MAKEITRDNTVEEFLKERGAAAVADAAKKLFVSRFNALAETAAATAIAAAKVDKPDEPKVEVAHLTKAFEGLGWSTAGGALDPGGILARLHQLPPEQIAVLVKLIREWLAAQPK